MNQQTPSLMKFVLYSTQQLVASDGAGFWSNDEGWVEFKAATQFTLDSVPSCNLPMSSEQDAKWIMWEPARPADKYASARNVQISLPLTTH